MSINVLFDPEDFYMDVAILEIIKYTERSKLADKSGWISHFHSSFCKWTFIPNNLNDDTWGATPLLKPFDIDLVDVIHVKNR